MSADSSAPPLVRRLLGRLDRSLSGWRSWQHLLVSLALISVVGVLDLLTGPALSLVLFYLIPVGISTWYVSPRVGFALAVLSASIWFETLLFDQLPLAIALWNAVIRLGFLAVYIYILAQLQQKVAMLHYLAYHDPLTDVLNRRAFRERVATARERVRAGGWPLTLAYLDLDNFKQVNDLHGHAVGDTLLIQLAKVLRSQLRTADQLARIGGDEFAILLLDVEAAVAVGIITRMQQQVDTMLAAEGWAASMSIGVVTFREIPASADAMLTVADQLMYEVKAAGKHGTRYAVYPPEP